MHEIHFDLLEDHLVVMFNFGAGVGWAVLGVHMNTLKGLRMSGRAKVLGCVPTSQLKSVCPCCTRFPNHRRWNFLCHANSPDNARHVWATIEFTILHKSDVRISEFLSKSRFGKHRRVRILLQRTIPRQSLHDSYLLYPKVWKALK